MTVEKLEAIEIDWTQGVAENFERVKSAALAALEAANRRAEEAEAESNAGWLFLNPDTGIEFNVNHPVESGEVPDAKNITSATAPALLHLLTEEWRDGKARESELTALRARVAELEARRKCYECGSEMTACAQCNPELVSAELATLRARVAELEAGGCARDQGTTQYCAEAVALQKRVAELEGAIKTIVLHAPSLDTIGIRGLCDEVMLPDAALKENSHDKG